IVPIVILWLILILSGLYTLFFSPLALFYFLLAIFWLFLIFLYYWIALIPYDLIQVLFFDVHPKLLEPKITFATANSEEGFTHLLIAIISSLPVCLINLIYVAKNTSIKTLTSLNVNFFECIPKQITMIKLSWIWLIIAVYLYHYLFISNRK
ncbi:MAG: hypothetical protein AAGF83_10655, partial [Cyanobacteria bacterium P01_G01_bin.67]